MSTHDERPRRAVAMAMAVAIWTLAACTDGRNGDPAPSASSTTSGQHAAGADAPATTNRVAVPATVRANLGITFVTVERRRIEQTLRVPGRFEYAPTARREYSATLAGRVELLVQQFERVEAGTPLFRLDSPAWHERQLALAETESNIERLTARLAAYTPLLAAHAQHEEKLEESIAVLEASVAQLEALGEVGGGRLTELSNVRAALATARAELARAEEEFAELGAARATDEVDRRWALTERTLALRTISSLLGFDAGELVAPDAGGAATAPEPRWRSLEQIVVRATHPGVVESLEVADGSWLDERAPVLRVVRPERLRFHAQGLQSDLGRLRDGLDARIVPPFPTNAARAIKLQDTMSGALALGLAADPGSRTLDLYVTPEALSDWARPGTSAQLEIVTDSTGDTELAIPLAAVQRDGLLPVLFRRNPKDPNEVIRIEGDLGPDDGRWIAVLSGLRDGDEVVLDGSFQLMLATSGSIQKGGHFHADGTFHEGDD